MIIDTKDAGTCKGCHKLVYWRIEKSGKANSYDPPSPCGPCNGEGFIVIHKLGEDERVDCERCDGRGRVQISHFATCVHAAAFRTKR